MSLLSVFFIPAFFLLPLVSIAQAKFDNIWIIGHGGEGMTFDFSSGPPTILGNNIEIYHYAANASICDSLGNLLFYTNGVYVANADHQPMDNSFLDLGLLTNGPDQGVNVPQIVLILPLPDSPGIYYLFYKALYNPTPNTLSSRFYYAIIDMSLNDGLGGIVDKDHLVLQGVYLHWGEITACKHANGRDYWLLMSEEGSNNYHRFLFGPQGLWSVGVQSIGDPISIGVGQAVFSPDGNYFASLNLFDFNNGGTIDIYSFDRCEGYLYDPIRISYSDGSGSGGAAFSPNSRFLYIPSQYHVFQYDLWASGLTSFQEVVGVYDGFLSPFEASFFLAQLAPDGKIYINAGNGVDVMHVINHPNEKGMACDFAQHSIQLPTYNAFSMPNFPNFNLGTMDDGPCDTIGLSTATATASYGDMAISPNPAGDEVLIKTNQAGKGSLSVFDVTGKLSLTKHLETWGTEERLDVSSLPAGAYYMVFQNDKNLFFHQKLIISK